MAKTPIETIKSWFETGDTPTQSQFWSWLDSFFHKDENVPADHVEGLDDLLHEKASKELFDNHVGSAMAHEVVTEITGTGDYNIDNILTPGIYKNGGDVTLVYGAHDAPLSDINIEPYQNSVVIRVTKHIDFNGAVYIRQEISSFFRGKTAYRTKFGETWMSDFLLSDNIRHVDKVTSNKTLSKTNHGAELLINGNVIFNILNTLPEQFMMTGTVVGTGSTLVISTGIGVVLHDYTNMAAGDAFKLVRDPETGDFYIKIF